MKILHVFPSLNYGGTEQFILNLMKYQRSVENFNVKILSNGGPFEENFKDANIHLIRSKMNFRYSNIISDLISIIHTVDQFKPNIVHTHSLRSMVLSKLTIKILNLKTPLIHTLHGGPRKNYIKTAKKLSFFTDAFVALNKSALSEINNNKNHVYFIANGVSEPNLNEIEDVKSICYDSNNKIRIAFIGRISKQKGLDVLLEAVKLSLKSEFQLELIIVGDGPEKDNMQSLSSELGINRLCKFIGEKKNPWLTIKNIRIIVMPSNWEEMPMVALEAIARNKILVTSNIAPFTNIRDYFLNSSDVYLTQFMVGNAFELYSAIVSSSKVYDSIPESLRRSVIISENTGPKYTKLYNEIIENALI